VPSPTPDTHRLKGTLRLAIALVLLGLLTHGTFAGSGDEPHYLAIAHSVAFDHDLDLANNYGANEPLIGGGGLAPESHLHAGVGGVMRPVHDVGMPLVFAPAVRVLRPLAAWLSTTLPEPFLRRVRVTPTVLYRHLVSMVMVVVTVWLAGMLFDAFVQLGTPARPAAAIAALVILSPPLLIFSILFFTELPAAALAFYVFRRTVLAPATTVAGWAVVGAVTGFLFLLHARNAGLVAPLIVLGLAAAWREKRAVHAAVFVAGAAALLALRTAINHHFWGTWITTPHAALGAGSDVGWTIRTMALRSAGMLVDQEFGLLIYAPLLLLVPLGLVRMRERPVARALMFVSACYVALILWPVTNVHGWQGGWNPAARFVLPIVPLLALALPTAFSAAPRALAILLLVVQIGIDAYMWQHPKDLWNDGDGLAAVCTRTGASWCRWLPSIPNKIPVP
jgi:hypothetical protein